MELHAKRVADVVLLRPSGRVDHANADTFGQALAPHLENCKAGSDSVLIDLSGLEYISSAGLRILMLASKQVVPVGGRVGLASPQKVVAEIFKISRFQYVMPIHGTIAAGLASLSPAAAAAYPGT